MNHKPVRLLVRADDAGSCESANAACLEVVERGIARNVGIMVPGPAFEGAARLFAGVQAACIGLHVTINAEWDAVRWGPVLPAARVPSLVDERGDFHNSPGVTHEAGVDAGQVLAEAEAQLARGREAGLRFGYLDTHMGFEWLAGVHEALGALAKREGLLFAGAMALDRLPPDPEADGQDAAAVLRRRLAVAPPGAYLLVTHPGRDEPDMRAMGHAGLAPGEVARRRAADTGMLTDAGVLAVCEQRVELRRYDDEEGRAPGPRNF